MIINSFVILLLLLSTVSCQNKTKTIKIHAPSLLFIEDIDGQDGIGMGNFGDIVLQNLDNSKKYFITDDRFFDEYPSYSKLNNRIYFNSLRANQTIAGISSEMNIFYYDLKTKKIVQYDTPEFYEKWKISRTNYSYQPIVSKNGKYLAFKTRSLKYLGKNTICVFNLENDSLVRTIDNILIIYSQTWDSNDERLVFSSSFSLKNSSTTNYVGMVNINTKKYDKLFSRQNEFLRVSDIWGDDLLLIKRNLGNNKQYFEIDDIKTKECKYIIEISSLDFEEVKTPKFINENEIIFIGVKVINDEYPINNIFKYNFTNNKIQQITKDGFIKDNLFIVN